GSCCVAGVVGMSPRATTRPSSASITNTLRLLCTSSPTYASIGLPSLVRLGRNATPWSAVDLTAAGGQPAFIETRWRWLTRHVDRGGPGAHDRPLHRPHAERSQGLDHPRGARDSVRGPHRQPDGG